MRSLGILGGKDVSANMVSLWVQSAEFVIAADQGADLIPVHIRVPDVLIGDLDSVSETGKESAARIIRDGCQETTDTEKLLKFCERESLGQVTLLGVEGDLLDHVLANLYCIAKTELDVRLALRTGMMWSVRSAQPRSLAVPVGRRVSLLPVESCSGVNLGGVQWPLSNAALAPGAAYSISNRSMSSRVEVSLGSGTALLFVQLMEDEMPRWDG